MENVVKEAQEEASIPADLAARARPAGALRYLCERSEGLRNDVVFSFDLELSAGFVPQPNDDEVEEFSLWPMQQVLQRLEGSDDFKFNVALVNLDFRSEEHTSELQSLMRISYAVFCLKKTKKDHHTHV